MSRCGQNTRVRVRVRVSVSPTAIEFSCHPPEAVRRFSCPSKCLGIGLGGFTPLILFLISTSCLGLEMFRVRIRGVYPPNSIPILNKHNNELNAVRRRPRTNSYHPSETKNVLFSLVVRRFNSSAGGQERFVSLVMRRFKSSAGGHELFYIVRRRP